MPDFQTEVKKELKKELAKLEQNEINDATKAYRLYVEKLKVLNDMTEDQYKKDSFGLDKALTKDKFMQIKELYADCGILGEKLLDELKNKQDDHSYSVIVNIQNMLSRDMKMLNRVAAYNIEAMNASLQKIIDASRIRTVDISGRNLDRVGANMSSRIPFTYVEPDGNKMAGVFTPNVRFDLEASYDKFVDDLSTEAPGFADIFKAFKQYYINKYNESLKKKGRDINSVTDGEKLFDGLVRINQYIKGNQIGNLKKVMLDVDTKKGWQFARFLDTHGGMHEYTKFCAFYGKVLNSMAVNYKGAEIADKSRIDSRNSAMSCVADLLGVPHVICRAFPMKIVQDGQEIEGTFMGLAKGIDIKAPDPHCLDISYEPDGPVFKNSTGMKDIADLQILDFICGNVDRHPGNMFYRFNNTDPNPKNHKFIGVQGIDNDASFGTVIPKDNNDYVDMRFICLNNLKVISSSMYNKVMDLDPEMLRFSLREHGLTEAQINTAGKRLTILKNYLEASNDEYKKETSQKILSDPNHVKDNTIRIVPDGDFKKINLNAMIPSGPDPNSSNSFEVVSCFRQECQIGYRANPGGKPLDPPKIEEIQLYRLKPDEYNWALDVANRLDNVTQKFRSSDKFRDIQDAVKRYQAFCETNKGSVLSEDLYEIRRNYLTDISKAANTYLEGKKSVWKPSEYTQHRIDAVTDILNEVSAKANEDYYGDLMNYMDDEDKSRFADGLHRYADRSLDDFNAKMRAMALDIAKKHSVKLPEEYKEKANPKEVTANKDDLSGPGI